jgi:O-antigen/teichoic acid export membrane protein
MENLDCQDDEVNEGAAISWAETLASQAPAEQPTDAQVPMSATAGRHSVMYLVSALAGGNFVSMAIRLAGGILQARLAGHAVQGLFGSFALILGYTRFLQAGIFNGLNRELPFFFGKGDRRRVHDLAAAAQVWAAILSVGVGAVFAGIAAWYTFHRDFLTAAGWGSNICLAFGLFFGTLYLQATYRTAHDFARLSMINVAQNGLALVLVALVVVWGFYGVCLRAVVPGLAGVWMLYRWRPIRVASQWDDGHFMHLLRIGVPIALVGELGPLWELLDTTLVWKYLGTLGVGLYYPVGIVHVTMNLLPIAMGQILYPRMTQEYARTGSVGRTLLLTVKPTLASALGMSVVVVIGWWLAAPLTRWLLPDYFAAVPAMQWTLLVSYVFSFSYVHNIYLVVHRMGLYAVVFIAGLASYYAALLWLIRNGTTLVAFQQAMLIGQLVYVLAGHVLLVPIFLGVKKVP